MCWKIIFTSFRVSWILWSLLLSLGTLCFISLTLSISREIHWDTLGFKYQKTLTQPGLNDRKIYYLTEQEVQRKSGSLLWCIIVLISFSGESFVSLSCHWLILRFAFAKSKKTTAGPAISQHSKVQQQGGPFLPGSSLQSGGNFLLISPPSRISLLMSYCPYLGSLLKPKSFTGKGKGTTVIAQNK